MLSCINLNATTTSSKMEKIAASFELTGLIGLLTPVPKLIPKITVGYKMLNQYNDSPWESVWVGSLTAADGSTKNSYMDSSLRQHARLHTVSLLVQEELGNLILADFFYEYQYCAKTLYEKRNNAKLTLEPTREIRGSIGLNVFGFGEPTPERLIISFGMGKYWDPGIAVQRNKGASLTAVGYIFKCTYEAPIWGAELMVDYNYSGELRKLIESTDKVALECSAYFRI
jgi:hypothetical protein